MRFFPSFKKSNVTSNQKYMETVRDKEKNRDKDDGKSDAGKSQYQSVYKIGELQDKGMFIHDLLASEYDNENVAVTKTKLKQQESPEMPPFFSPKNSSTNRSGVTQMRLKKQESGPTVNAFSNPTDNAFSGPTENAFSGEND